MVDVTHHGDYRGPLLEAPPPPFGRARLLGNLQHRIFLLLGCRRFGFLFHYGVAQRLDDER